MKFFGYIAIVVHILLFIAGSELSVFSQQYKTIHISKDIELIKLSEHAYVHVSYATLPKFGRFGSNGLIYADQGKAYLFDTPVNDSLTRALVNWITDSLKLQLIGFVPNHWHDDCMGGLGYLQSQGIASYANQKTIDMAKSKGLPVPAHGFKDSLTLKLNDKPVCCYYLGGGHTPDNIVVWIPAENILFAGCMCKELAATNLGNLADSDVKAWPATMNKVIVKFPTAKIVIPGHGQVGGTALLQHTSELLKK